MSKNWLGLPQYTPVANRKDAYEMAEGEARAVVRSANRDYPKLTWEVVKVSDGRNLFIVEGTPKK